MDPIDFLPVELKEAATKLPKGKEYTLLDLPPEGEGHNAGLIRVANKCYKMGVSYDDTLAHLQEIYHRDRIDYNAAPQRAAQRAWHNEGETNKEEDEIEAASGLDEQEGLLLRFRRTTAAQVEEESPHEGNPHPCDIIRTLFEPDEIVNIQQTQREHGTLCKVSDLPKGKDIVPYKFLNPSTFKKVEGVEVKQPDGSVKTMTRCNVNVKKRKFMVLEYDYQGDDPNGPAMVERFNTLIMTFSGFAPLAMVVDTGNKSLHAWFFVGDADEKTVAGFFRVARLHGADRQLAVKSQIARMPNVSSAGKGRDAQKLIYLDADVMSNPEKQKWELGKLEDHLKQSKHLEYYYYKNSYYMQSNTERWVTISRVALQNHLALQGYRREMLEGELASPVDIATAQIESDRAVESVLLGASGKHAGYYEENGYNFLVLKSPTLIKPRKGSFDNIRAFLEWMFRSDPKQLEIYLGWLSDSARAYRNGGKRQALYKPAQGLFIAGDNDSGKSFLHKVIMPFMLGGRVAKADFLFDPKSSDFNADAFGSELLVLDDTSVLGTSHKERHISTEKVKDITVGMGDGYHSKGVDRVACTPWWRFLRVMNSNPEQLATLPLAEKGAGDKWILLHAQTMDGGPVDKTQPGWFDSWKKKIVSELPAFLHFLLREFVIPDDVKDPYGRYAVKSYKNPHLIQYLEEDSLETYLLHKIDSESKEEMFTDDFNKAFKPWLGTSSQLYDLLAACGSQQTQRRFSKMCPSPRVLSSQLSLLETRFPDRVAYSTRQNVFPRKKKGVFYWIIYPEGFRSLTPDMLKEEDVNEEDCF